jgi:hypothetical protein
MVQHLQVDDEREELSIEGSLLQKHKELVKVRHLTWMLTKQPSK